MNFLRVIEEAVKEELKQDKKPLILFMLGGVDVGKSYTVTAIANRFHALGLKVAVVDADVGQSDIGPPCCIGMGILRKEIKQISEIPLHSLYFVGNTSPNGCVRECVEGAAAAVNKAKALNATVIIVDSTGWIEGEEARMFKLTEIVEINPSFIIAIAKEDELAHILPHLHKKVIKLRTSSEAKSRTREERRALREDAYNKYFSAAKNRVFALSILEWIPEEGTLLGLFDGKSETYEKEAIGLGVLSNLDYERGRAVVFTPVDTGDAATTSWIKPCSVQLIEAKSCI
ncbi:Polyribonucleotide 5'-hydroxyl-kinase [ANME-1 cluster archaeon GoMg2]|nr:Polyribonucleotide 5'-hydroxyl-kinase [ANME-1 cluster archaeon GoMg2]